jgi:hypothetical protein
MRTGVLSVHCVRSVVVSDTRISRCLIVQLRQLSPERAFSYPRPHSLCVETRIHPGLSDSRVPVLLTQLDGGHLEEMVRMLQTLLSSLQRHGDSWKTGTPQFCKEQPGIQGRDWCEK